MMNMAMMIQKTTKRPYKIYLHVSHVEREDAGTC